LSPSPRRDQGRTRRRAGREAGPLDSDHGLDHRDRPDPAVPHPPPHRHPRPRQPWLALWIRTLLRSLAAAGRTVFLSSHLMSEMSMTADRLIIIGRGRLIAQTTVKDFLDAGSGGFVRVRSPQASALAKLLAAREPRSPAGPTTRSASPARPGRPSGNLPG